MIQAALKRRWNKKDEEKFDKAIREYMNSSKGKKKTNRIFSKLDKKIEKNEEEYLV